MSLIAMLVVTFGLLLVIVTYDMQPRFMKPGRPVIDSAALRDPILNYHLDWGSLRDERFRFYLYVKRVNAVKRYEHVAGVSHEQAQAAIEIILVDTRLAERLRPLKQRPALPQIHEQRLHDLIAEGQFAAAERLYCRLTDVDVFTARKAVADMETDVWLARLGAADVRLHSPMRHDDHRVAGAAFAVRKDGGHDR